MLLMMPMGMVKVKILELLLTMAMLEVQKLFEIQVWQILKVIWLQLNL